MEAPPCGALHILFFSRCVPPSRTARLTTKPLVLPMTLPSREGATKGSPWPHGCPSPLPSFPHIGLVSRLGIFVSICEECAGPKTPHQSRGVVAFKRLVSCEGRVSNLIGISVVNSTEIPLYEITIVVVREIYNKPEGKRSGKINKIRYPQDDTRISIVFSLEMFDFYIWEGANPVS